MKPVLMKKQKIGVVVPTLNSAATLEWTLLSLRKQRVCDLTIIVADSGSTDGTIEICNKWDVECAYIPPGNMYRAINFALQQCSTEWLAYLNSDDWLYPDSLARLIHKGEGANADIVYGNCDYADSYGRFAYSFAAAKPNLLLPLFRRKIIGFAQPTAIFRRSIYQEQNGFNEVYYLGADYDFFFRSLLSGAKFANLPGSPVACFRLHEMQLSNKRAKDMETEIHSIWSNLVGKECISDRLLETLWRTKNLPHYTLRFLRTSLLLSPGRLGYKTRMTRVE
jgi:glycosyltransferase involved in cell wall biosynthesis